MAKLSHREKAIAERKNPPDEDPEFQIAPMIDVLLVLMTFFMTITTSEVLQVNREIQLPVAKDAKSKENNTPGQVVVNLTWIEIGNVGGIEVDQRKYASPGEIIPILQRSISANPLARVLIRADRKVRYEYLKDVLRAVGAAGVQNVTFSVVDKEAS